MSHWIQRGIEHTEKVVETWSKAKRKAAGIPTIKKSPASQAAGVNDLLATGKATQVDE